MTARIFVFLTILGFGLPILGQKASGVIVDLNAASYTQPILASGSIVAEFGKHLSSTSLAGNGEPILNGTQVFIEASNGLVIIAPLLFVAPGQVNYVIPSEIANGVARVELRTRQNEFHLGYIEIVDSAPRSSPAKINGEPIARAIAFGSGPSYECDPSGCRVREIVVGRSPLIIFQGTGIRHCPPDQLKLFIGTDQLRPIGVTTEAPGLDGPFWF